MSELSEISNSYIVKHSELIQKNVNDYSFITELINSINNYNYSRPAFDILSGNVQTQESYIWNALSNIVGVKTNIMHDDIQHELEDNILNFIDNVSDIDCCKVKSLQSMIQLLGVNYNIFDKLKIMPLTIVKLIDILSIKKEYLVKSNKLTKLFSTLLYEQISSNVDNNNVNNISNLTDLRLSSIISAETSVLINNNYNLSIDTYSLSSLFDEHELSIKYENYIEQEKLDEFTTAIFTNVLNNFCYLTYNNYSSRTIYNELSQSYLEQDFSVDNNDTNELIELKKYRTKYNISKTFNSIIEANNIEQGFSSINDYSEHEKYLINAELDYRYRPMEQKRPESRYHYYRERIVRDYFKFVENECADLSNLYNSATKYIIDNSFIEVSSISSVQLATKTDNGNLYINDNYIKNVAKTLTNIVNAIRDIREQVKTQVQKNFIKGTKLHLEYVIREYIRTNIYSMFKKIFANSELSDKLLSIEYNISDVIVNINEYVDPTEYFNISTDIDQLSNNVNSPYWKSQQSFRTIAGFNDNNIFKNPTIANAGITKTFDNNDISNFYLQLMQCSFDTRLSLNNSDIQQIYLHDQIQHMNKFRNYVYNSACDTSYADNGNICCDLDFKVIEIKDLPKNIFNTIINNINNITENLSTTILPNDFIEHALDKFNEFQNNADITDEFEDITLELYNELIQNVTEQLDETGNKLSDLNIVPLSVTPDDIDWRKYKNKLFKKYSGNTIGQSPFANMKNQRHPTYQVHPYIDNFVPYDDLQYPIPNMANVPTNSTIHDFIIHDISNYVNNDGKLINVWKNPLNTNTDYITLYEKNNNKTDLNIILPQCDYEGLIYPEFKNKLEDIDTSVIDDISSNNCDEYKYLNLSKDELKNIANKLKIYNPYFHNTILSLNYIYVIYRYGRDLYGNQYFLIKEKKDNIIDDYGIIYMKLKNHPIAFPLITFNNDPNDNIINENTSQILFVDNKYTLTKSVGFTNLSCISLAEINIKTLLVKDFTISTNKSEILLIVKENDSNSSQDTIIHCNIKKEFINSSNYTGNKYYLIRDNYNVSNSFNPDADTRMTILSGFTVEKFYNFNNCIGTVQTKKDVNGSISIYMPFWDRYKLYSENNENTSLSIAVSLQNIYNTDNIKVDVVDNKKMLTIAYLKNDINTLELSTNISNYLGYAINYNSGYSNLTTQNVEVDSPYIVTKEFKYDEKTITEVDFERSYLLYNDMGFIPLHKGENSIIGKPYETWLSSGQLLKFNLAEDTDTSKHGIFFKHIVPVRMQEGFKSNLKICELSNDLSIAKASFVDARYLEHNTTYLTDITNDNIYDPYKLQEIINNYNITLRIDESYINDLAVANITKHIVDKYDDTPYLWIKHGNNTNNNDITAINEFYKPGTNNDIKFNNNVISSNVYQYILKLNNTDEISVTWINKNENIFGEGNGIKLDFNAIHYINNINNDEDNTSTYNYYNYKHSFLNLDKPGDGGCLRIYNQIDNSTYQESDSVYFIKNISDTKPKFIIVNVSDRFKPPSVNDIDKYTLYTEDITYKHDDINVGSIPIITEFKIGFDKISF